MTNNEQDLVEAAARHPRVIINIIAALVSGGMVAGAGYYAIRDDLKNVDEANKRNERAIVKVEARVNEIEKSASNKLEGVQRDVSDVKASIRGIEASMRILLDQNRLRRPDQP